MANVNDVAKYIIEKMGTLPAMKFQKLVYYCQAWSLVWDDAPLFKADIQAWINGPVIPRLYAMHRGHYDINHWPAGDSSNLTENQKETIDIVLKHYGSQNSQWLSDLTHSEMPWQKARKGLAPNDRGKSVITLESMAEYYSSLN